MARMGSYVRSHGVARYADRCGGRPVVATTHLETARLYRLFMRGTSVDNISMKLGVTREEIQRAVRFEVHLLLGTPWARELERAQLLICT